MIEFLRSIVDRFTPKQTDDYRLSFRQLIVRTEQRLVRAWEDNGIHHLPICEVCATDRACRSPMYLRHSNIVVKKGVPIRDDQAWKCTQCYHTTHFGIPMTRTDALREIYLRGGSPLLSRPTIRPDERHREEVKERLRKLGYLENG